MRIYAALILLTLVTVFILTSHDLANAFIDKWNKVSPLSPTCTFNQNTPNESCYAYNINDVNHTSENYVSNGTVSRTPLPSTVSIPESPNVIFSKSKVRSETIPDYRYFHVAEPSFASNGTLIFYTANHLASRFTNNSGWQYVDPYFDFQGVTPGGNTTSGNSSGATPLTFDIFWADQRALYSPAHKIYIWVRQSKTFDLSSGLQTSNIDRLAVSKDTRKWTAYDIQSDKFFTDIGSSNFFLDYPQIALGNKYLYMTTSLINENENKSYGVILRFPLNDLGNFTASSYGTFLDREVDGIIPVEGLGKNNTAYFGAQIPVTNDKIRIYEWAENSREPKFHDVRIDSWNDIHNTEYCGASSVYWWCKANFADSRIRSAWLFKNSINFLWNSVATNGNGTTWNPYIEIATIKLDDNFTYDNSAKYRVVDKNHTWIYASVVPSIDGRLGVAAFTTSGNASNPYMNLAFGVFNDTIKKWEMTDLVNSSFTLPVINDEGNEDFNWGDFLTIRQHVGNYEDKYIWDIGGFVLSGNQSKDTDPYFIMVKDKS